MIFPSNTQNRQAERKSAEVFANLVSTFCYLSLEGKLGQLLHGRRGQRLLRGHPHAAEYDDDHGEDEEHAARHVNQDVGIEVVLLRAHFCPGTGKSGHYHLFNTKTIFKNYLKQ